MRTHSLIFEDTPVVAAAFDRVLAQHTLIARPAALVKLLGQFHGTDVASILARPDLVQLQSFHENSTETTGACLCACVALRCMLHVPFVLCLWVWQR